MDTSLLNLQSIICRNIEELCASELPKYLGIKADLFFPKFFNSIAIIEKVPIRNTDSSFETSAHAQMSLNQYENFYVLL